MSAPIIWIIIPFIMAIVLWFAQEKHKLSMSFSVGLCLLLGLTALFQNIDSALRIGQFALNIPSTMSILGRSFILDNSNRVFLAFVYLSLAFWHLGSRTVRTSSKFIPLSLTFVSLLTAALAVKPFLYSAILIELAVIISLPLLITREKPIGKGVIRYLIFQSLAMPFILLAGWILSGVETNFSDMSQLYIAALFLGLGFAFWLGVFPFHFWIPEFCSENDIYINGFVMSILPVAVILIILDHINGLAWLRDSSFLVPALRVSGTLMVVTGGVWAAMQNELRKLFGYLVIVETGFLLVYVSLNQGINLQLFYYGVIARAVELFLITFSLRLLQMHTIGVDFSTLKGRIKDYPIAIPVIAICVFSSAGLPLLASFPVRVILFSQTSSEPVLLFWFVLASLAILFAGSNVLRATMTGISGKWSRLETIPQILVMTLGIFFLFLMGIIPSIFLQGIWGKISTFLAVH